MKKVKVTNAAVIRAHEALVVLSQKPFHVKAGFPISKALRTLAAARRDVEEYRDKLLTEHAELDESGKRKTEEDASGTKTVVLKDEEAFREAWRALLEEETTIEVQQITVEDFGDVAVEPTLLTPIMDILFKD